MLNTVRCWAESCAGQGRGGRWGGPYWSAPIISLGDYLWLHSLQAWFLTFVGMVQQFPTSLHQFYPCFNKLWWLFLSLNDAHFLPFVVTVRTVFDGKCSLMLRLHETPCSMLFLLPKVYHTYTSVLNDCLLCWFLSCPQLERVNFVLSSIWYHTQRVGIAWQMLTWIKLLTSKRSLLNKKCKGKLGSMWRWLSLLVLLQTLEDAGLLWNVHLQSQKMID